MRVIFAGTPLVAIPTLEALWRSHHVIVGVLTRHDAPLGRKRVMTRSPVASWASDHGIPIIHSNRPDESTNAAVKALTPEIGVVVAYGAILGPSTLAVPRHGWMNLHFSDLPRWRGAAPVQRAILAGDSTTATTVFRLDTGLDTGDVIDRVVSPLGAHETASEVLDRLARSGAEQVVAALDAWERGEVRPVPQTGEATRAPKTTGDEGRLIPDEGLAVTYRRFRAMTEEPGAYIETPSGRLIVRQARPAAGALVPCGRVEVRDGRVVVGLSDGGLEIERLHPAGKSVMPALDWFRGTRETSIPVENV